MQKAKLYTLLLTVSICGYVWTFYCMNRIEGQGVWQGCVTKQFLHIPCPSCGTTRSLMCLLRGEWVEALYVNPLGYLAAMLLAVTPVWVLIDWCMHTSSLLKTYNVAITLLKRPAVCLPMVVLVILNWLWNIIKFS